MPQKIAIISNDLKAIDHIKGCLKAVTTIPYDTHVFHDRKDAALWLLNARELLAIIVDVEMDNGKGLSIFKMAPIQAPTIMYFNPNRYLDQLFERFNIYSLHKNCSQRECADIMSDFNAAKPKYNPNIPGVLRRFFAGLSADGEDLLLRAENRFQTIALADVIHLTEQPDGSCKLLDNASQVYELNRPFQTLLTDLKDLGFCQTNSTTLLNTKYLELYNPKYNVAILAQNKGRLSVDEAFAHELQDAANQKTT